MLFSGIRVVEMGVWVAGPAAGGVLADWGADVVKLEPPAGDPMRRLFQNLAGIDLASCPPFNQDNRGKRSIVLDLRQPEAMRAARRLILEADVFLTNYRRDALERLGLDHASLAAEAPRLIYAHVTGYGQEGPDRDRAGYDIGSFWARSGIAHLLSAPGEEPVGARGGFGDHITASHLLAGVAAALFHRERTGRGQLVDACLLRSGIYTIGWDISLQLELGACRQNGKREESFAPTVSSYRCGDGRWVWLLGVEADRHWPRMLAALGLDELSSDPRFMSAAARRQNARALMALLDARFAERGFEEWTARFDAEDLWWSPVQTPADVVRDPQALAAQAFTDVPAPNGEGTVRSVASPVRFGEVDVTPRGGVPGLGQHTDEILREAGLDESEIAKLRASGALGAAS
jgi:crotonobetainyl-CoA:carnitine CoA-transferase CaiB-like acyl-CoA transferase